MNQAAVVREVDGKLVLDDPAALAMVRAVGKHNCIATLSANIERVDHFVRRTKELGRSAADVVIVLLAVDDPNGCAIAEMLMPNTDWQPFRDVGEVPIARGLAGRAGIQEVLEAFDREAAEKLRDAKALAIVVVDHGVAEVFFDYRGPRHG